MNEYVNKKNNVNYFFVAFIIFIIFRPSPTLLLGPVFGLRIMDFTMLLFLIIYIFMKRNVRYQIDNTARMLMIMLFLQIISISLSIFNVNIVTEDIFEVFRPILYLVMYIVIKNVYTFKSLNYLYNGIFFSLVIGFLELYNIFNIESLLMYVYDHSKSRSIDSTSWRIVGSFYNPNYFGYYLSVIVNIALIMILFKIRTYYSILISISSLYLLFFTGSRTALVSVGISIVITLILYLIKQGAGKISRKLILIFGLVLTLLFLGPYILDYVNENFKRFNDIDNIAYNFYTRVSVWEYAFEFIKENPLFGSGPGKSIINSFDNNYIIILFRYGIVSLVIFILLLLYLYLSAAKNFFKNSSVTLSIASLVMIAMLNILIITMITAIPFDFIQSGSLFICSIAIYTAIVRSTLKYEKK